MNKSFSHLRNSKISQEFVKILIKHTKTAICIQTIPWHNKKHTHKSRSWNENKIIHEWMQITKMTSVYKKRHVHTDCLVRLNQQYWNSSFWKSIFFLSFFPDFYLICSKYISQFENVINCRSASNADSLWYHLNGL